MTDRQRLELRASEIRTRLNELGGMETLTDDQTAEVDQFTAEYRTVETRVRALTVAGDAPAAPPEGDAPPEDRELRSLLGRANLGTIFDGVLSHRSTDGAEREVQQHFGLESNQVPLDMLRVETRAVTPAPADVGQTQSEIIPYVFPQACAAFLGVDMPTVGVGEAVFPVLTAKTDVHAPAENAAAAETTGAFSADVLSPSRLQASFFYSREDRARFRGMDESLRQNLSDALADGLDSKIIAGTNGLLTGANLANHNVAAVTTFAKYVSEFGYSRVDGRYASMASEIRVVMGSGTYAHAGGIYRGNNSEETALDRLMRATGGVKVSAHVPAVSGNKQNAIIRRGMRRDMVVPIWDGVTLIPDEVTKAGTGQIVITVVMLHAVKILRVDGFYKQQTQHA